ncbi:MAG: beta-lactamase family protein [Marinicaulis sp.]|nr:beta-lactamase family protein [Marinicaulis sp.]
MKVDRRTFMAGSAVLAAAGTASASTQTSGGGAAEKKALNKLEDYINQHRADWGIPGMTACVVNRDGFEGIVCSGFADVDKDVRVGPDHLFQVGSITKMMTALTAWSLIDEGTLSPETRLRDAMPEIKVQGGDEITLQHLLNHTSGLPRSINMYHDDGLWTGPAAGTHYAYSNLGYRLAGAIVARADGRSYPKCVEERVLRPIGMINSVGAMRSIDRPRYAKGYQPLLLDRPSARPAPMVDAPWVDFDGASGCVAATASDMAKFLKFLLGLAEGKGGDVFSNETAVRFLADPASRNGNGFYGNGVSRVKYGGRDYLHHTGGMVSFSSALHVDPEAGVAAFASGNVHYARDYRPRDVTILGCRLLHAATTGVALSSGRSTKSSVSEPSKYAGVYTSEGGDSFEIAAASNSISMHRSGASAAMQSIGSNYFQCDDPAFAETGLHFELKEGKAIRAWAGGVEYLTDPSTGYKETPAAVAGLEGYYDNDDRWGLPTRVFARGDKLCLTSANYTSMWRRKDNGDWRLDTGGPSAEWLRFDTFIDGKPQRVIGSGEVSYRRFS